MITIISYFFIGFAFGLLIFMFFKYLTLSSKYDYDMTVVKEDIVSLNVDVDYLKSLVIPNLSKSYIEDKSL